MKFESRPPHFISPIGLYSSAKNAVHSTRPQSQFCTVSSYSEIPRKRKMIISAKLLNVCVHVYVFTRVMFTTLLVCQMLNRITFQSLLPGNTKPGCKLHCLGNTKLGVCRL